MSISEKTKKYIEQLNSESKKERDVAIQFLSKKQNKSVVTNLLSLMNENTSTEFREGVCKIFRKHKAEEAIDFLIKCLDDPDNGVRYHAISALGDIDTFKDVKPLIRKLKQKHTDPILRSEIISVLGNIGDEKAIDALINILRNDKDKFVRHDAARALGKMGDQRAISALTKIANDEKNTRLYYLAMNAVNKIKKG